MFAVVWTIEIILRSFWGDFAFVDNIKSIFFISQGEENKYSQQLNTIHTQSNIKIVQIVVALMHL